MTKVVLFVDLITLPTTSHNKNAKRIYQELHVQCYFQRLRDGFPLHRIKTPSLTNDSVIGKSIGIYLQTT